MQKTYKVQLPLKVSEGGIDWKLYSFDFKTQEGTFTSYFYAVSFLHASYVLEEMKATAVLSGEMLEVI